MYVLIKDTTVALSILSRGDGCFAVDERTEPGIYQLRDATQL
jgi:hypothetical protein